MDPYQIIRLIEQYNENPDRYTDEEAEFIAQLAQGMNARFARESKPIQKGLFDLLDTAAFGLIPDRFRPTTRGETVFGDTGEEELASLLGLVGGGVVGGVGLVKGGRGLINRFKRGKKSSGGNSMTTYGGADVDADDFTQFYYDNAIRPDMNRRNNLLQLTQPTPLQLTRRQRLLSGQTGRQVRQNRFPLDSTSGEAIAMRSSRRNPLPTDAGTTYRDLITQYELASPRNVRKQYAEDLVNEYFRLNPLTQPTPLLLNRPSGVNFNDELVDKLKNTILSSRIRNL